MTGKQPETCLKFTHGCGEISVKSFVHLLVLHEISWGVASTVFWAVENPQEMTGGPGKPRVKYDKKGDMGCTT